MHSKTFVSCLITTLCSWCWKGQVSCACRFLDEERRPRAAATWLRVTKPARAASLGRNQGCPSVSLCDVVKLGLLWFGSSVLSNRVQTWIQNWGVLSSPPHIREGPQRDQLSVGHFAFLISKESLVGNSQKWLHSVCTFPSSSPLSL